jgi:hypothetical protein
MERSIVSTIYRVRPTERLSCVFNQANSNRTDLSVKSGSTVELHVWQGMLHVFPANVALLHAAREARSIFCCSGKRAGWRMSGRAKTACQPCTFPTPSGFTGWRSKRAKRARAKAASEEVVALRAIDEREPYSSKPWEQRNATGNLSGR